MGVTDILYEEHRVIGRVLDAIESAAEQLDRGEIVRPGFFMEASDFVAGFADGCHHRKEESVLFGVMVDHGAPSHGGAIDMMLEEHGQGRLLNGAMREGARRLAEGDMAARAKIVSNAKAYVALLRDHIAKEDEMLFPMAEELIPAHANASVLAAFVRVDHAASDGSRARFLALAERLEEEATFPGMLDPNR